MTVSTRPGGYEHAVRSTDPLVSFLYRLMRDYVTPGLVEGIVVEWEQAAEEQGSPLETAFSNDFLAAYAFEIAGRLSGVTPEEALIAAHDELRFAQHEPPEEVKIRPRNPQLEPAPERR